MPHTTDNGLQIAIWIAKEMKIKKRRYREAICTTWPEEENLLSQEKVLDELIQRLEARAEVATGDDGWISVEDRLPEEGQKVICYRDTEIAQIFITTWSETEKVYEKWNAVTHWQPLPLPPTK